MKFVVNLSRQLWSHVVSLEQCSSTMLVPSSLLSSLNMGRFLDSPLGAVILGSAITGALTTLMKIRGLRNVVNTKKAVVVITGCDSGVGYSLALHCHELGFNVFAGVLNVNGKGAKSLKEINDTSGNITVFSLDVTKSEDIHHCVQLVAQFLDNNTDFYLHSIVNNAGIMIFGELEWLTDDIIFQQINVNLLGAICFTKSFLPLLRKYKGRIVNVSSHCALAGLPGLAVYAASKSGLQAWNDAIRVEYRKYGITVISIIPGSFIDQSNILLNQSEHVKSMESAMSDEAKGFYGDYFGRYQQYVSGFSRDLSLHRLKDKTFYNMFTDALVSKTPACFYENSPFRYSVYHFLFRVLPLPLRDYFMERFVQMPRYEGK